LAQDFGSDALIQRYFSSMFHYADKSGG